MSKKINIKTIETILETYMAVQHELLQKPEDQCKVSAMLVLAAELRGVHEELQRIAQVLGAKEMTSLSRPVKQSDVPDNLLALLTALKATQG